MPVAIFDLDGTLIDTAWDVALALNPGLREHGLPELDAAQAARLMGHGLQRFAGGAFARHGRVPDDVDITAFIERYARAGGANASLPRRARDAGQGCCASCTGP